MYLKSHFKIKPHVFNLRIENNHTHYTSECVLGLKARFECNRLFGKKVILPPALTKITIYFYGMCNNLSFIFVVITVV